MNTDLTETEQFNKLRQDCWDKALDSFGYAYIFDRRAAWYGKLIFYLNFTSVLVPVLVGLTATGYGFNSNILKYVINVAIPATIIQFIYSMLAIFGKWDDKMAYAYESAQSHNYLYNSFKNLASYPPVDFNEFKGKHAVVDTEADARGRQDTKQTISEKEMRRGMRYALREFKRPCAGCAKVPISMEPTDCAICGKF